MLVELLKSKIHRATVTDACLDYEGSITIDKELMEEARLFPHEKVQVLNTNNGERFETYVIEGKPKSGIICLNGAAARLVQKKDLVIIAAYVLMTPEEARSWKPKVVKVNEKNRIKIKKKE
ncbi:MAG: aspartate 1-decarboxylase [Fibromonadaceae bacterium]|jgi:aspartate 1-decarboxylase|nr:aspartate 1-decarboxylase [Fibromonadaceae bacterium]